jgi:DNA-binding transcriptional MerR regulator
MQQYKQITFDFSSTEEEEKADQPDQPSVGIRIKQLKPPSDEVGQTANSSGPEVASEPEPVETQSVGEAVIKKAKGRGRKPVSSYLNDAEQVNIPPEEVLFSKQYYSIGEVAEMFAVKPSLLRFWETEFSILQPKKNKKGDRHYRPADIQNLQLIYDLLRRRKLTIDGARQFIKNNNKSREKLASIKKLQELKAYFLEIQALLK